MASAALIRQASASPGDFVRNCKQLIDLLHQIEDVAEGDTASRFRAARASVMHGVVAYTGV